MVICEGKREMYNKNYFNWCVPNGLWLNNLGLLRLIVKNNSNINDFI
jgi:hypothetical protein